MNNNTATDSDNEPGAELTQYHCSCNKLVLELDRDDHNTICTEQYQQCPIIPCSELIKRSELWKHILQCSHYSFSSYLIEYGSEGRIYIDEFYNSISTSSPAYKPQYWTNRLNYQSFYKEHFNRSAAEATKNALTINNNNINSTATATSNTATDISIYDLSNPIELLICSICNQRYLICTNADIRNSSLSTRGLNQHSHQFKLYITAEQYNQHQLLCKQAHSIESTATTDNTNNDNTSSFDSSTGIYKFSPAKSPLFIDHLVNGGLVFYLNWNSNNPIYSYDNGIRGNLFRSQHYYNYTSNSDYSSYSPYLANNNQYITSSSHSLDNSLTVTEPAVIESNSNNSTAESAVETKSKMNYTESFHSKVSNWFLSGASIFGINYYTADQSLAIQSKSTDPSDYPISYSKYYLFDSNNNKWIEAPFPTAQPQPQQQLTESTITDIDATNAIIRLKYPYNPRSIPTGNIILPLIRIHNSIIIPQHTIDEITPLYHQFIRPHIAPYIIKDLLDLVLSYC